MHDNIKFLKCNKCLLTFGTNGSLKRHITDVHIKTKNITCSKCDYVCTSNAILKSHEKCFHQRPIMDKHMSLGEYAIYNYLNKKKCISKREII